MRTAWVLAASLATLPGAAAVAADGISISSVRQPAWALGGLGVMGDYYFLSKALPGTTGGFRATSGLVVGTRASPWASAIAVPRALGSDRQGLASEGSEGATLPYLGFGYTGLSVRGGWSFSADLGVLAHNPGPAVRFGRVFTGAQTFDELMRDLRIAPVLQLGVSYAF